ncbi:hypothetical protein [Leptospira kmetyi]|uniref:hypothetical protein n=1 Tax=Leptospira kmetyi TaxID=408139 RepID=UPI0010828C69|nr:hypothetical protein [Leptospira kmetyi]TGK21634.1 hypothetical protein EHO62_04275 [Leptospira kmetyi]TGK28561.1 hypothetical protein EHO66_13755 [Leptospira kmetyi]
MKNNHLTLVSRIKLPSANRFIVHKNHAFVCQLYGEARDIHVIDLKNPEKPELVRSIPFQSAIGSLAIRNETLYATESRRALHSFDLKEVSDPKPIDSYILLGYDLYDTAIVNDKAVLAMNWDGVGVVDLNRPNEIQPLQKQKIEKGYVERLVPFQDHFILTNGISDDRFLYEISLINGKLEILSKTSFPNFNPTKKVFSISSGVILYGETKIGKKEYSSVLILDENLRQIGDPIRLERTPNVCLSLSNGDVLFGFDYSYAIFDRSEHKIVPLFQQYETGDKKEYFEVASNPRRVDPEYDHNGYNEEDESEDDETEDQDDAELDEEIDDEDENIEKDADETDDEDEEEESPTIQGRDPRLDHSYCMDSLKWVYKNGNYLFATHGDDFISFRISENSPFQNIL